MHIQITKSVFLLLLLTVFVAVFMPSKAYAMRFCEFEEPEFVTRMATTKTQYIRTENAFSLTDMSGHRGGGMILGLGGGEIGYKVEVAYMVKNDGQNYCIGLHKVKVVFYGKPQVHIASNFKRGSCEYQAVLAHEQKHIRTMRQFIKEYAPKFKRKVQAIAASSRKVIGPVSQSQVEKAQGDLQKQIVSQLEEYLGQMSPILQARQQKIDNPDEYKRVSDTCKNWDKKLADEG